MRIIFNISNRFLYVKTEKNNTLFFRPLIYEKTKSFFHKLKPKSSALSDS